MSEKKYTKDHEWVSIENEIATIGISNHAQDCLLYTSPSPRDTA